MIELASQPTPIQSLYVWYSENKLYVNRRYQRKLVWTLEEKQKLIESILKKYPVPAILIAEREEAAGTYEIIDGLQRLHAIMSFIEMAFPTIEGKYFGLQHFPTAQSRANDKAFITPENTEPSLSAKAVGTILDYTLAVSVMRNVTEAEVNDVFDRINTYGHRLSDQERRQAGIQNEFSTMIRQLACTLRGDASTDILLLNSMPSISIDLPMTKHGYKVQADEVFWVKQGILRTTDLRDSMDEQCIADIAACIVQGKTIERSKDALDRLYTTDTPESTQLLEALKLYGSEKFAAEFKFCIDEILEVCEEGTPKKLRDVIFKKKTSNAFPSVFAILLMSFHELIVKEEKKIANYANIKDALVDMDQRIETNRRATSPEERRKNINTIKGLIGSFFVEDNTQKIYGNHAITDIESIIRRSEFELADYELKQGLLPLTDNREINTEMTKKVINTICAIANNGPNRIGKLIIGVTDKDSDANKIKELDKIEPRVIGNRSIVGVTREARSLQISTEDYFSIWKNAIRKSGLSEPLKNSVMSNIDYHSYYGLGIIVITIQPQKELSYVDNHVYWRIGNETQRADAVK
ncbi:MAG TPA: DUF262 domain-containing protein, partial [Candidatus Nitrosopolaris rasttigaisensis]|nr:DUF262 domain-containing protein [Candidatus Nitrosopolaris rasttigaisensis]